MERGNRLIKWAAESNSPTFHLVICFTLFPLGILHLADIQLCTNNQLSLQICRDSAVALCQAFSHIQWIFSLHKKPAVTKSVDKGTLQPGRNNKSLYYETAFLLMIQNGQTVYQLPESYSLLHKGICHLQRRCDPLLMSAIPSQRRTCGSVVPGAHRAVVELHCKQS